MFCKLKGDKYERLKDNIEELLINNKIWKI